MENTYYILLFIISFVIILWSCFKDTTTWFTSRITVRWHFLFHEQATKFIFILIMNLKPTGTPITNNFSYLFSMVSDSLAKCNKFFRSNSFQLILFILYFIWLSRYNADPSYYLWILRGRASHLVLVNRCKNLRKNYLKNK